MVPFRMGTSVSADAYDHHSEHSQFTYTSPVEDWPFSDCVGLFWTGDPTTALLAAQVRT